MLRRPSKRRHRLGTEKELEISSFLNLLVILIPYLLATAVFTRLAALEISLPTAGAPGAVASPSQKLGLTIRILPESIEVVGGGKKVASIRGTGKEDEMAELSGILKGLKKEFPRENGAAVLSQAGIHYQTLIKVMDAARDAGFPEISIGEVRSP